MTPHAKEKYHLADVDVQGTKMFKTSFKKWVLQSVLIPSELVCFENGMEILGSMKAEISLASWANIRF
jgi:hypothetical protein